MDVSDVVGFVKAEGENRHQELKQSISWNSETAKFKITKTVLAMANIQNGGRIIIGAAEIKGKFSAIGVTESDYESFNQDDVCDYVGKYADPYARFQLHKINDTSKRFVVLTIEEFEKSPVVCKKDYFLKNELGQVKSSLQMGDICTRTSGAKPESSKVKSHQNPEEPDHVLPRIRYRKTNLSSLE